MEDLCENAGHNSSSCLEATIVNTVPLNAIPVSDEHDQTLPVLSIVGSLIMITGAIVLTAVCPPVGLALGFGLIGLGGGTTLLSLIFSKKDNQAQKAKEGVEGFPAPYGNTIPHDTADSALLPQAPSHEDVVGEDTVDRAIVARPQIIQPINTQNPPVKNSLTDILEEARESLEKPLCPLELSFQEKLAQLKIAIAGMEEKCGHQEINDNFAVLIIDLLRQKRILESIDLEHMQSEENKCQNIRKDIVAKLQNQLGKAKLQTQKQYLEARKTMWFWQKKSPREQKLQTLLLECQEQTQRHTSCLARCISLFESKMSEEFRIPLTSIDLLRKEMDEIDSHRIKIDFLLSEDNIEAEEAEKLICLMNLCDKKILTIEKNIKKTNNDLQVLKSFLSSIRKNFLPKLEGETKIIMELNSMLFKKEQQARKIEEEIDSLIIQEKNSDIELLRRMRNSSKSDFLSHSSREKLDAIFSDISSLKISIAKNEQDSAKDIKNIIRKTSMEYLVSISEEIKIFCEKDYSEMKKESREDILKTLDSRMSEHKRLLLKLQKHVIEKDNQALEIKGMSSLSLKSKKLEDIIHETQKDIEKTKGKQGGKNITEKIKQLESKKELYEKLLSSLKEGTYLAYREQFLLELKKMQEKICIVPNNEFQRGIINKCKNHISWVESAIKEIGSSPKANDPFCILTKEEASLILKKPWSQAQEKLEQKSENLVLKSKECIERINSLCLQIREEDRAGNITEQKRLLVEIIKSLIERNTIAEKIELMIHDVGSQKDEGMQKAEEEARTICQIIDEHLNGSLLSEHAKAYLSAIRLTVTREKVTLQSTLGNQMADLQKSLTSIEKSRDSSISQSVLGIIFPHKNNLELMTILPGRNNLGSPVDAMSRAMSDFLINMERKKEEIQESHKSSRKDSCPVSDKTTTLIQEMMEMMTKTRKTLADWELQVEYKKNIWSSSEEKKRLTSLHSLISELTEDTKLEPCIVRTLQSLQDNRIFIYKTKIEEEEENLKKIQSMIYQPITTTIPALQDLLLIHLPNVACVSLSQYLFHNFLTQEHEEEHKKTELDILEASKLRLQISDYLRIMTQRHLTEQEKSHLETLGEKFYSLFTQIYSGMNKYIYRLEHSRIRSRARIPSNADTTQRSMQNPYFLLGLLEKACQQARLTATDSSLTCLNHVYGYFQQAVLERSIEEKIERSREQLASISPCAAWERLMTQVRNRGQICPAIYRAYNDDRIKRRLGIYMP